MIKNCRYASMRYKGWYKMKSVLKTNYDEDSPHIAPSPSLKDFAMAISRQFYVC
jgi:hypothetical protein